MLGINKLVPIAIYDMISDTAIIEYVLIKKSKKTDLNLALNGVGYSSNNSSLIYERNNVEGIYNALDPQGLVKYMSMIDDGTAAGLLVAGTGFANVAVTAAGANQAAATALAVALSVVTTATADQGVKLPVIAAATNRLTVYYVINSTAVNIKVYPGLGDFINGSAVNVAVDIPAGGRAAFYTKKDALPATDGKGWNRLSY